MHRIYQLSVTLIITVSLSTLLSCGGSDGPDLSWNEGIFKNENDYKNLCQNPRSGADANGNSFPDKKGSTLHETHWLRSWSNNTYLWYDEIIDQNPALFDDPILYFDTLKTENLTATGSKKDNFHFSVDSAEWITLSQSGVSSGYGLQWALISKSPPRKLRVAFSEPNGPAAAQNFVRGAEVLEIDGVDLINDNTQAGIDILNSGIAPAEVGETHTFLIRDLGATQTRTISLTSANIQEEAIFASDVIQTNSGNVGYVMYNTFRAFSEQSLVNTFTQLQSQNITDLILDLRYNGGGLLDLASETAYMIAGPTQTQDKIFERTVFNDKHPIFNPVTGEKLQPQPFFSESTRFGNVAEGTPLPTLNLSRVFILSTGNTCSASESVINGLRGIDVEVFLIGDSTCGKPYGFYSTDNCGTTYFTIQFSGENNKGFGEYPDGFTPDNSTGQLGVPVPGCNVADDYNHALGDTSEALLRQALEFRDTGTCSTLAANNEDSIRFNTNPKNGELDLKLPQLINEKTLTKRGNF